MTLELAQDDYSTLNQLPTKSFASFFQGCCSILKKEVSGDGFPDLIKEYVGNLSLIEIKRCSGQLFSFISEMCKIDATEQQIRSALDEYSMDEEHIKIIVKGIKKYKNSIRQTLKQTSLGIPKLIGIDWRLCQDIKQKKMSQINKPKFLVKLKFNNNSEKVFECSHEEMQDLLHKLKVARNSVKRLISQS